MPAATVRVPTIFSAVDRFTSVTDRMSRSVTRFADRAQAGVSRVNRWFRRLTPSIGEAGKQLLSLVSAGAIVAGAMAGITFSFKSLVDYQKQVASFRTIVSDLSDTDFSKFSKQIGVVAKQSKGLASTVDVAASFEKIAGLNADFAKTATGLGMVSTAAITLSKASGDDLATSADNLVGIMNQFSLGAEQANRVINVLAAGQAVGAATITEAAESYKNFGAVAKGANITLEQSVALIQTLAARQIKGAEAGTALRGAVLRLQKAGIGYKSSQFKINDALEEMIHKTAKLSSARKKDAFLLKVFGAENITAGKNLLELIGKYKLFTTLVTGTSEAQKAAAINTDTFSEKVNKLKNRWITYITTNDKAATGLKKLGNMFDWVGDNMDSIIANAVTFIKWFAIIKGLIWGVQIALWAYNVAIGIAGGLTGVANIAIGKSPVALAAYKIAMAVATAATWLWNAALAANPIVWVVAAIVAGVAAIIAIIYYWDDITKWFSKQWDKFSKWITGVWQSVVDSFTNFDLKKFFMDIGASIIEFLLTPLKMALKLASLIPGSIGRGAAEGLKMLDNMTANLNVTQQVQTKPALASPVVTAQVQANQQQQDNRSRLDINLNDPGSVVKNVTPSGPLKPSVSVGRTNNVR